MGIDHEDLDERMPSLQDEVAESQPPLAPNHLATPLVAGSTDEVSNAPKPTASTPLTSTPLLVGTIDEASNTGHAAAAAAPPHADTTNEVRTAEPTTVTAPHGHSPASSTPSGSDPLQVPIIPHATPTAVTTKIGCDASVPTPAAGSRDDSGASRGVASASIATSSQTTHPASLNIVAPPHATTVESPMEVDMPSSVVVTPPQVVNESVDPGITRAPSEPPAAEVPTHGDAASAARQNSSVPANTAVTTQSQPQDSTAQSTTAPPPSNAASREDAPVIKPPLLSVLTKFRGDLQTKAAGNQSPLTDQEKASGSASGSTGDGDPQSIDKLSDGLDIDTPIPPWIKTLLEVFMKSDFGGGWRELLRSWLKFEWSGGDWKNEVSPPSLL